MQIAVVGAGDRNLGDMAAAIVGQLNQARGEVEEPQGESMQSTIVRLASVHSTMELSREEASELEQMVRKSNRGVAR